MKTIQVFIILLFLFSCTETEKGNSEDFFYGFVRASENNYNVLLTINTRFDECGERGGHNEKITVFSKNDDTKIYADYEETEVDCGSLGKYGDLNQNILLRKTQKIDELKKSAIKNYFKELVEYKSKDFVTGNSGKSYYAVSQDSSFQIRLYNNDSNCEKSFEKLKSNLNF